MVADLVRGLVKRHSPRIWYLEAFVSMKQQMLVIVEALIASRCLTIFYLIYTQFRIFWSWIFQFYSFFKKLLALSNIRAYRKDTKINHNGVSSRYTHGKKQMKSRRNYSVGN